MSEKTYRVLILGAEPYPVPSSFKKIEIKIPKKLVEIMKKLYSEIDTEFSVYIYGDVQPWPVIADKENEVSIIIKDYYFARQRAHSAYVEMLENAPVKEGMRLLGTIHKHPAGLKSFSVIDHEYTNSKFPLNLLFTKPSIYWSSWSEPKIVAATIWCIDPAEIATNILYLQIAETTVIARLKDKKNIFVKAKLCEIEDANLDIVLYGEEPKKEDIEKEIEEILKKIERVGYSVESENKEKDQEKKEEKKEKAKKNKIKVKIIKIKKEAKKEEGGDKR